MERPGGSGNLGLGPQGPTLSRPKTAQRMTVPNGGYGGSQANLLDFPPRLAYIEDMDSKVVGTKRCGSCGAALVPFAGVKVCASGACTYSVTLPTMRVQQRETIAYKVGQLIGRVAA